MTEKPSNPTADAMRKALAAKRDAGGHTPQSAPGNAHREEKGVAFQNAALNKPAFRRASKRG